MRRLQRSTSWLAMSLVTSCLLTGHAVAQFETDARWAPPGTNVLVMMHSHRLFDSPLAKKERGKEIGRASFESGISVVTPDVDRLLLASQMDFEVMHTLWTSAVLTGGNRKFDLGEIANTAGVSLETIANHKAVLMSNDAYLVRLSPESVGVMRPGNRQAVSRWIKSATNSGSNQLSGYLKQAVVAADKNLDVIIAMDLADSLDPKEIRKRLSTMESVPQEELDSLTETLSAIEGISLGIRVQEALTGSIKVDVQQGGRGLAKNGKALLIEILKRRGVMIDDITSWNAKADERSLILSGPLSMAGLNAISSLISQPLIGEQYAASGNDDTTLGPHSRSKTYYDSLDNYYHQVASKKIDYDTISNYVTWFDLYAKKIEDFSILGVDEELVAVGSEVASNFRKISNLIQQMSAAVRLQKTELKANYGYYGWDARYGYGARYRDYQLKAIEARGEAFAEKEVLEILNKINTDLVRIKQSLSVKYGVNF